MTEISNVAVIGIGIGTVFAGLVCLILICNIMGALVKAFSRKETEEKETNNKVQQAPANVNVNKGEFVAAIAAAIAEDLGEDVTGIRIKSIKRV